MKSFNLKSYLCVVILYVFTLSILDQFFQLGFNSFNFTRIQIVRDLKADQDTEQLNQVQFKIIGENKDAVTILAPVDPNVTKECLDAGLELEHRFLLKSCGKLNRFGIVCKEERKEVHSLSYDPIKDLYKVDKDRLGDDLDPERKSYPEYEKALAAIAIIDSMPLHFVDKGLVPNLNSNSADKQLGMRIRTTCKGEVSRVIAELSYFFTFGFIDLYGYDSGWKYYSLSDTAH